MQTQQMQTQVLAAFELGKQNTAFELEAKTGMSLASLYPILDSLCRSEDIRKLPNNSYVIASDDYDFYAVRF